MISTNNVCKYKNIIEFATLEVIFHHEEEDLGKATTADSRGKESKDVSVGEHRRCS